MTGLLVRRDHRPYWLKAISNRWIRFYVRHWLRPQFAHLGRGAVFLGHRNVRIIGAGISVGDHALFFGESDNCINLTSWHQNDCDGRVEIGDYALLTPGVRIAAAQKVELGHSCMLASGVYISDCDWHGIYDRAFSLGEIRPVRLGDNVWLGTRAMVGKGVTIGDNSIVGAGAMVTSDVPANTVVAGVPATRVADLDPKRKFVARADMFTDPDKLNELYTYLDKYNLKGNSLFGWARAALAPASED